MKNYLNYKKEVAIATYARLISVFLYTVVFSSCSSNEKGLEPIQKESYVAIWGPEQIKIIEEKISASDQLVIAYIDEASSVSSLFSNAIPNPQEVLSQDENIGMEQVNRDSNLAQAFAIDFRFNKNNSSLIKAEEFVMAWINTYNLNLPNSGLFTSVYHLIPFTRAYELIRDEMTEQNRNSVDNFFRALYEVSDEHIKNDPYVRPYGNHWSYHAYNLTSIGFLLSDQEIIDKAETIFNEQIDWNLFPGGTLYNFYSNSPKGDVLLGFLTDCQNVTNIEFPMSTFDWCNRDSLGYHIITLMRLLESGLIARNNGLDWLNRQGQQGMKLEDGFNLLENYIDTDHLEYVNSCIEDDIGKIPWIVQPDDIIKTLASGSLISNRFNQWAGTEYGSFTLIFELTSN